MFGRGRRVARRTARRTSRRVMRRQALFDSMEEPEYGEEAPAAPAAPAAPPPATDYAAELQKLAQLKEQGLITEADFEAKKKKILGI
jgi:Short C-terminal domain